MALVWEEGEVQGEGLGSFLTLGFAFIGSGEGAWCPGICYGSIEAVESRLLYGVEAEAIENETKPICA